jgi:hypothetical protein
LRADGLLRSTLASARARRGVSVSAKSVVGRSSAGSLCFALARQDVLASYHFGSVVL